MLSQQVDQHAPCMLKHTRNSFSSRSQQTR